MLPDKTTVSIEVIENNKKGNKNIGDKFENVKKTDLLTNNYDIGKEVNYTINEKQRKYEKDPNCIEYTQNLAKAESEKNIYKGSRKTEDNVARYQPFKELLNKIFPNYINKNQPDAAVAKDIKNIDNLKYFVSFPVGLIDEFATFLGEIKTLHNSEDLNAEISKINEIMYGSDDKSKPIKQENKHKIKSEFSDPVPGTGADDSIDKKIEILRTLQSYLINLGELLEDEFPDSIVNTNADDFEDDRKELEEYSTNTEGKPFGSLFNSQQGRFSKTEGKNIYIKYLETLLASKDKSKFQSFVRKVKDEVKKSNSDNLTKVNTLLSGIGAQINELKDIHMSNDNRINNIDSPKTYLSDAVSSSEGEIESIQWGKDRLKVFRKNKREPDIYNKTALDSMGFKKPHNFFAQLEDNILKDNIMFGTLMEDPSKVQSQIEYYDKYVDMLREYKTSLLRVKSQEKQKTPEELYSEIMKYKK
jgi:hypothetical protein